jgi:hypothetical protein
MHEQRFNVRVLGPEISLPIDEALAGEITVTFVIESGPASGSRWVIAKSLGGERLLCAMRLQRVDSVEVSPSEPGLTHHLANLRDELIDRALQQLETYPPLSALPPLEAS